MRCYYRSITSGRLLNIQLLCSYQQKKYFNLHAHLVLRMNIAIDLTKTITQYRNIGLPIYFVFF